MTTGIAGFVGGQPQVRVGPAVRPPERELYQQVWQHEKYREVAPGEECYLEFLKQARPRAGSHVIDLGCGTGRGALMLALPPPIGGGMKVTLLDVTDNSLDEDIHNALTTQAHVLDFVQHDLSEPLTLRAPYGYCTDVLEHIRPHRVDQVLFNILEACQHTFFQISTEDDKLGALVGHPLHLTVRPYAWWLEKFRALGCVIHWSEERDGYCLFYVTMWMQGPEISDNGVLNVEEQQARDNVKHNIAQGWQQVIPHETNNFDMMILGGGPSLDTFKDEIKARRAAGAKLVTLNGAYNWCLANDIKPSAQVMVDARQFNARFTKPVISDCLYLLASQVDPSVLYDLPKERTWLWHTSADLFRDLLDAQYPGGWWAIPGGSTVLTRAIPLLRMLGYHRFTLYGCDSCVTENEQHAYEQKENDGDKLFPVFANGDNRKFICTAWMIAQATEFMQLIKFMGDEFELEIPGDGLLSHILKIGAERLDEETN